MNPYLIIGPALWSFSGGRTSAKMVHDAVAAHGGALPGDHVVTFANTGLEDEKTLRFVRDVAFWLGIRVIWLEWRPKASYAMPEKIKGTKLGAWWEQAVARCGESGFEVVDFDSASQSGEPFKALVAKKGYPPNALARFCTMELKIRVMRDFCQALGWERWANIVGLRADEWPRLLKMKQRNAAKKERFHAVAPMADAGDRKRDVMTFWLGENTDPYDLKHPLPQGFDLGLRDHEGNCRFCFLKAKKKLLTLIRENAEGVEHMIEIEMEMRDSGQFVTEYSFADLVALANASPMLPGIMDDAYEDDGDSEEECGLICGGGE